MIVVLAAAGAALAAVAAPPPAAACSGARVEFAEIRAEASRIVVGTITASRGDPLGPDAIAIRVERLIRGSSPVDLILDPPDYMGCDGRIAEPIGTRLVIATGLQFFDAAPPNDLHPYWIVGPDGVLDPAGVENADPAVRTVDDLVMAVGGGLTPVPVPMDPAVQAAPDGPMTDDAATEVRWSILAAAGVIAAVVLGVWRFRSRRRSE